MDKALFQKLGTEWKELDDRYDRAVQEVIDSREPRLGAERLAELKEMQKKLYALEEQIFSMLQE